MARPRVHVFFGLVDISRVYLELAALAGRSAHVSVYQLIIITVSFLTVGLSFSQPWIVEFTQQYTPSFIVKTLCVSCLARIWERSVSRERGQCTVWDLEFHNSRQGHERMWDFREIATGATVWGLSCCCSPFFTVNKFTVSFWKSPALGPVLTTKVTKTFLSLIKMVKYYFLQCQ